MRPTLTLNPGSDRRLRAGHPWIFSNEIRSVAENKTLEPGTLATEFTDREGRASGCG